MGSNGRGKYGDLRLMRGGVYASRELTPEEWLEREVRSWAAQGKTADGKRYASRALADIASDVRYGPHRIPARLIRDGLEAKAPTSWARRYGLILMEYAERKAKAMGRLTEQPNRAA